MVISELASLFPGRPPRRRLPPPLHLQQLPMKLTFPTPAVPIPVATLPADPIALGPIPKGPS